MKVNPAPSGCDPCRCCGHFAIVFMDYMCDHVFAAFVLVTRSSKDKGHMGIWESEGSEIIKRRK